MVMCGLYMELRLGVQRGLRAGGKLVFPIVTISWTFGDLIICLTYK